MSRMAMLYTLLNGDANSCIFAFLHLINDDDGAAKHPPTHCIPWVSPALAHALGCST